MPSTLRPRTLLLLGCALLGAACMRRESPELEFTLNANLVSNEDSKLYSEALAADAGMQANLLGSLEMLFGTPSAPRYMLPEDWVDQEYDPNDSSYELSEAQWEAVVADNEDRFAKELEAVARGNFDAVRIPANAPDLADVWASWMADLEDLRAGVAAGESEESELTEFEELFKEEASYLFSEYYPSLRDAGEIYRRECYHCHGINGGGNGSTADFLNPRPRDYRLGRFKYTALNWSQSGSKATPRREDLLTILENGIYGTAMPSFKRFSKAELHGMADYVRLLAVRGETEILLADSYDPDAFGFPLETVVETYDFVWNKWIGRDPEVISVDEVPPVTEAMLARGRELFVFDAPRGAKCASCHGVDGRGDGGSAFEPRTLTPEEQAELETLEGTIADLEAAFEKADPDDHHGYKAAAFALERAQNRRFELTQKRIIDDWGNEISPRDLTRGLYRFGRRPIDLFRRIHTGIQGTPMPAHYGMELEDEDGNRQPLSEEDVWALVHYVRSLATNQHGG